MTKSWMKLLAIPALFAGARALFVTTDYPPQSFFKVGDEFPVEWTSDGSEPVDAASITLSTYSMYPGRDPEGNPVFNTTYGSLAESYEIANLKYTWVIEPVEGRTGEEWLYIINIGYRYGNGGSTSTGVRPFHLEY